MSTNSHLQMLIKKRLNGDFVLSRQENGPDEKFLIRKNDLVQVVYFLRQDPDAYLDLLLDIFCSDHGENQLEVFYLLRSSKLGYRLSISILLDEAEPSIPSLSSLYASAIWLEREMWDMFGIFAEGHPNLSRLIMYAGFAGHPMRRSYPITKEQALVPIYKI
jgi:NADH-quinone oxidoreductase subunit C